MYCEGLEDIPFPDDDPDLIGDRYLSTVSPDKRLDCNFFFFPLQCKSKMADKILTVCSQVSRWSSDTEFRVWLCAGGWWRDLRLCSRYRGCQALYQEMWDELDSLHAGKIQQTWLSEGPHRGWGRIVIHVMLIHCPKICVGWGTMQNLTAPFVSVAPVEDDAEFPWRGGGPSRLFPLQLPLSDQGRHSRQGHWPQCGQKHDGMSSIFSQG